MNKKIWFKKKRYGWGWTPSSWEGWVATLGYMAVLFFSAWKVKAGEMGFGVIFILTTCLFMYTTYKKGEEVNWNKFKQD